MHQEQLPGVLMFLTPVVVSSGSSQSQLSTRHFFTLHSAALTRLIRIKAKTKKYSERSTQRPPDQHLVRAFPSFCPFFLASSLSLSLSLARSLLHLPFFVFLILSRSFVASFPVCQLTQVVSRSGIYITCFFNINIPVLPIILNYYFRPSKWALSDEAFFWGLSGVISLQSPSSCSPALPFFLFHLVRFRTSSGSAVFVAVKFVRRVSFPGHRMTFVSFRRTIHPA